MQIPPFVIALAQIFEFAFGTLLIGSIESLKFKFLKEIRGSTGVGRGSGGTVGILLGWVVSSGIKVGGVPGVDVVKVVPSVGAVVPGDRFSHELVTTSSFQRSWEFGPWFGSVEPQPAVYKINF